MTNSQHADEENLSIDEQEGQPWRSEFNALLGRMKTLEQQCQQQHQEDTIVNSDDSTPNVTRKNQILSDTAAEEAKTKNNGTTFRRHSVLRHLLGKQHHQPQRSHSAPEVTLHHLDESVAGLEEVDLRYDNFHLPESSFTFLITEPILSAPFAVGLVAYAVSLVCLALALQNELVKGTDDNKYAIAEVTSTVRIVQYLGVVIGVLMDDEIPTGLELIGKALEQKSEGDNVFPRNKIFFSSILRISIGAMFLTCLFFVVIQESNVLDIFFDMVALEFVESIDDVIFNLCRRGFFSRRMKVAANQENMLHCSSSHGARRIRKWSKRFIRAMYFLTAIVLLFGLTYITIEQTRGAYGCRSLIVNLGDGLWENAWVQLDKQCSVDADCNNSNQRCYREKKEAFCYENRLLIYSHFNGYYNHKGTKGERPSYEEMNKESGDPFKTTDPAELMYCREIESWVFRHPKIRSSLDIGEEHECNWLLRSDETDDFDLVELSTTENWFLWKGEIKQDYKIKVRCAECANDSDCNYFGKCVSETDVDQKCECFPGRFGVFCENEMPCEVIRSEKDRNTTLKIVKDLDKDGDNIDFVSLYGHPMYVANMKGKPYSVMRDGYPGESDQYFEVEYPVNTSIAVAPHKHESPDDYQDDDFFEINNKSVAFQQLVTNYTFLLRYTGRRWYGQIVDPSLSGESFKEEEYHAFWQNSFSGLGQEDNSTLIISEITSKVSPVEVDFFEMRRRNKVFEGGLYDYDYSPYGVMIPLVAHDGGGFFHCNKP